MMTLMAVKFKYAHPKLLLKLYEAPTEDENIVRFVLPFFLQVIACFCVYLTELRLSAGIRALKTLSHVPVQPWAHCAQMTDIDVIEWRLRMF